MGVRPSSMFGDWLKKRRKELGMTLRAFAERSGLDPGNLSRYERGVLAPPQGETLERVAKAFGLKPGSAEWAALQDLAAIGAGKIPQDLAEDPEVASQLPVLFRVARGKKLSREELLRLAERIRGR